MNQDDLSVLVSRPRNPQKSILSVYLSVDQSQSRNSSRRFEARLTKMGSALRKTLVSSRDRDQFSIALQGVLDFVGTYSPAGKGLVLFFDTTDQFFWHRTMDFPISDDMRFDSELLLQPLSAAADQMESYGVALASRSKLRLFVVSAGRIEEIVHEELDNRKVRHIRTAGTDHSESSSRIQRKADNQIHANLRGFIQKIDALSKARGLHRFVLAGASELTAELRESMPKVLSSSVIGEVVLPVTASPEKIMSVTKTAAEKYEHDTEIEKVNKLITSASKNGKAVVGLSQTLKAINSGRIWELIYGDALSSPGYACTGCAALFPAPGARCAYCGARVQRVGNIIERAVDRAFRKHARVEVVTEEACSALKKVGGIGAFLKTRTGSL